MPDNVSYTPEEVAKILKISKYTVYELIKRGELSAYHIGRKVRVEEADLEAYIQKKKGSASNNSEPSLAAPQANHKDLASSPVNLTVPSDIPSNIPPNNLSATINEGIILCGQDIILDILTRHLEKQFPHIPFLRKYVGSMDGLMALYRGQANAVTAHLWDSDSNEYNLPYIRRLIPGHQTVVINLVYRMEGFYVAKGNPKNITTWKDLSRNDVRFINRERGSGARVLLDEKLKTEKIPHHSIQGYDEEEMSHIAVASKVARGEADVGLGIEKAAMQVPGIDFIPLQKERYDLVVREEDLGKPHFQSLLQIIRSPSYRREVEGLGGYDVSMMGNIIA